jgi:hypothetical protein
MEESGLQVSRKAVLVVLFVPSVERDGITAINQEYWVDAALETFGRLFGGATAFPQAKGVWRDDEMGGVLVKDQPVVIPLLHDTHRHLRSGPSHSARGFLPQNGARSTSR